jgi:hypothetical protein
VRLGGVEMIFYSDNSAAALPPNNASRPTVKVSDILRSPPVPRRVQVRPVTSAVPAPTPSIAAESATEFLAGPRYCKYHPASPARHLCPKCQRAFCDLCINLTQAANQASRQCRSCGVEVVPFQFRLPPAKSFYSKLPRAFSYPFKGAGIVILICATIAFAALNFISVGFFALIIKFVFYGFLFLFMQNIILSTTSDEKQSLDFPDPSSLFGGAVQLAGTVLASFWLAFALAIAKYNEVPVPTEAILASVVLGGIYFPMALLAVAMKDTVLAANPLLVIPAIVKAPKKYSVTVLLVLLVFGIRRFGALASGVATTVSLHTHNVHTFMVAAALQMVLAFVSVYLLTVTMRILGLFYNSSKQQLGWYNS